MHSYIDLQTYKNRILIGMFTVLSADANPAVKARLTSQIRFVM